MIMHWILGGLVSIVWTATIAITTWAAADKVSERWRKRRKYQSDRRAAADPEALASAVSETQRGMQHLIVHVSPCGCSGQYRLVDTLRCIEHQVADDIAAMERQMGPNR